MPSTPEAAPTASPTVGMTKAELDTPVLLLDLDRFEANVAPAVVARSRPAARTGAPTPRATSRRGSPAARWSSGRSASPAPRSPRPRSWSTAASQHPHRQRARDPAQGRARRPAPGPRRGHDLRRRPVPRPASRRRSRPTSASRSRWSSTSTSAWTGPAWRPGRPALELARAIDRAPGLRLAGIMGYEGHVLTAWPNEEKRAGTVAAIAGLIESRRLIEADGMPVGIVSGGGSGNYMFAASLDGLTELQAGGALPHGPVLRQALPPRGARLRVRADDPDDGDQPADARARHHRRRLQDPVGARGGRSRSCSSTPDVELDYLSAEHGVWRRGAGQRGRSRSATGSRSSPTTTTRRRSGTTRSSACAAAWSRRSSRSSAAES